MGIAATSAVVSLDAYRLSIPLKEPYHLAFGELRAFDSVLVRAQTGEGRESWGETTACAGYVPETGDDIWDFVCQQAPGLVGASPARAGRQLARVASERPFAVTPLLTAVEGLDEETPRSNGEAAQDATVALVGILSAEREADLESGFWAQRQRGHTTMKLKVGFEVERDVRRAAFVQALTRQAPGTRIRIDANQGYSLADARRFVQTLQPDVVEHFEQPFGIDDWDSQVALAKVSPVPLMLDESILGVEDVERAAALRCATVVKFKLMKAGSAGLLADQIALARRLGLEVLLGNGVAGEVGCYQEAVAALRCGVETAGEMNGFLKLTASILSEPLPTAPGALLVRPDFRPTPDPPKLTQLAVDQRTWPSG